MSTEAETLHRALKRLPPRAEQQLWLRFVEGVPDDACARRYSIAEDAWAIHLLRAAKGFAEALKDPLGPPLLPRAEALAPDVEAHEARTLKAALNGEGAPTPLTQPLLRLGAEAATVRTEAEARARAELESPQFQRREQLRRLALFALVAAAIWLWHRAPPHR